MKNVIRLVVLVFVLIILTFVFMKNDSQLETEVISETQKDQLNTIITEDEIVMRVTATDEIFPSTTTPLDPDGPQSHWYYSEPLTLPEDVIITGFETRMENADISSLHHVGVYVNRVSTLCVMNFIKNGIGEQIYVASRHTSDPVELSAPYGVFLKKGEKLLVEFMEHSQAYPNGTHHTEEKIRPTVVITMHKDNSRTKPVNFLRLRLDDTECDDPVAHQAYVVPVGDEVFTRKAQGVGGSDVYTFTHDGEIVYSGANFWPNKGGQNVKMLINDEVKNEYFAQSGVESWLWNIPLKRDSIPIKTGDVLSLTADYINPFDTPVKDAAGMLGIYYYTISSSSDQTRSD